MWNNSELVRLSGDVVVWLSANLGIAVSVMGVVASAGVSIFLAKSITEKWNRKKFLFDIMSVVRPCYAETHITVANMNRLVSLYRQGHPMVYRYDYRKSPFGDHRKSVEALARKKWESAGCPEGRDDYFWLQAEQELFGCVGVLFDELLRPRSQRPFYPEHDKKVEEGKMSYEIHVEDSFEPRLDQLSEQLSSQIRAFSSAVFKVGPWIDKKDWDALDDIGLSLESCRLQLLKHEPLSRSQCEQADVIMAKLNSMCRM